MRFAVVSFDVRLVFSSTVGTTIVVNGIVAAVVPVITEDIDGSEEESIAIPSASYCARAIEGTTTINQSREYLNSIRLTFISNFKISWPF